MTSIIFLSSTSLTKLCKQYSTIFSFCCHCNNEYGKLIEYVPKVGVVVGEAALGARAALPPHHAVRVEQAAHSHRSRYST